METNNAYEIKARLRKADALFETLKAAGADYATVQAMGAKEWKLAAKAAKVNAPSETTIAEVTRIFKLVCAPVEADPFAGLQEVW